MRVISFVMEMGDQQKHTKMWYKTMIGESVKDHLLLFFPHSLMFLFFSSSFSLFVLVLFLMCAVLHSQPSIFAGDLIYIYNTKRPMCSHSLRSGNISAFFFLSSFFYICEINRYCAKWCLCFTKSQRLSEQNKLT